MGQDGGVLNSWGCGVVYGVHGARAQALGRMFGRVGVRVLYI